MKLPHIIGADLSKKTIDFASHELKVHTRVTNDRIGYQQLCKWLKQLHIDESQVMIVMEHTGLYSYLFEQFLHGRHIRFTKIPGLQIKKSMGLVRGKNDKQDAFRIARYGVEKAAQLVAVAPASQSLHRLQLLHSARERLVRSRASMTTALKETQQAYELKLSDPLIACQVKLIKTFDQQIKKLEEEIKSVIATEQSLCQNYQLLQSIKGVGKVLALATIIKTGNFTKFSTSRKFACFCGTAPFENTSGTSIRGKTRVSPLADKQLKSLLDMAAKSAIQHDEILRAYYLRRTESGKPKMNTINVVRNKIVHIMFAVIKRQTPYQPRPIAA